MILGEVILMPLLIITFYSLLWFTKFLLFTHSHKTVVDAFLILPKRQQPHQFAAKHNNPFVILTALFARNQHYNYQWKADLNVTTGLASSTETSTLQLSFPINAVHNSPSSSNDSYSKTQRIYQCIQTCFESYPTWGILRFLTKRACHLPVTCSNTTKMKKKAFPSSLLIFGYPISTLHGADGGLEVKIPVLGGWMTGKQTHPRDVSSSINFGYLSFHFTVSQYYSIENVHDRLPLQEVFAGTLCTHVIDYLPALYHKLHHVFQRFGNTIRHPSNRNPIQYLLFRWKVHLLTLGHAFCKYIYLYTQSIVHAFILWRFHKYCFSCLRKQMSISMEAK